MLQLQDQANQDISGDGITAIARIIANHLRRDVLVKELTNEEISQLFAGLNSYFDNQYEVAKSEGWNPWDSTNPCDFALDWAFSCLSIIPALVASDVIHTKVYISWFEKIPPGQGKALIRNILQERVGELYNISKLLEGEADVI